MFESSKNDLAEKILFGERVKTLLFLSMTTNFMLSFLIVKEPGTIDKAIIKKGVVTVVSPGSGAEWQRCFTCSFMLDSDDDNWLHLKDVHSISLSTEIKTPVELLKHEMSLNRIQHLGPIYTGATGRKKIDIEIDDDNDSKYYRLLSSLK